MACPVFGTAGMREWGKGRRGKRGEEREKRGGEEREAKRREKKKDESFVTKLLASHAGSPNPYHKRQD